MTTSEIGGLSPPFLTLALLDGRSASRSECFTPANNKNYKVEEDEMGGTCGTNGEKRNVYRLLVGKPERKRPLGRPRRSWIDNIKMEF
jgi:hypothetical protein